MKTKSVFLIMFVVTGSMLSIQCSDEAATKSEDAEDGSVTVEIKAPGNYKNKTALIHLYDSGTHVYDPDASPIESKTVKLDAAATGAVTLDAAASGGEIYQISGVIDRVGTQYVMPDVGDFLFYQRTETIDGDVVIVLDDANGVRYSPIYGDGSFNEASAGGHHVRIWESDTYSGSVSLGWIGDVDYMQFKFNCENGAIGRVGRNQYGAKQIDFLDDSECHVKAKIDYTGSGTYYFGIYGWVFDGFNWNNSTIRHEFYVVEDMTRDRETDPYLETITVGGIEYDMHRHDFGGGSYRFKAIRTTDRRQECTVNLKPFFEYWRQNGMENYFLNEITWHIELLGGRHSGSLRCWDIQVPSYE